jgi:RNA polymerase sigma factor (sigma-70 family)
MNGWDMIEPYEPMIHTIAKEYHRKFPMVEAHDIGQELRIWFAKHPKKVAEWEAKGKKDASNLIARSLRNAAIDFCQYWKAKTLGYEQSDLYYYDADVVEVFLPYVIKGDWSSIQQINLGGTKRPSAPAEGGNWMALMVDIDSAYWKLKKDDKRILFLRHVENFEYREIANVLSLGTEDAARMRHKRAVKRLIEKIGGYRPYKDNDYSETQPS